MFIPVVDPFGAIRFPLFCRARTGVPSGDELERSVTLMARIRSANSPAFSPDGNTIAFISDLNGLPQVWTVSSQGGWPDLVTALDDPVSGLSWSPDAHLACLHPGARWWDE